MTGRVVGRHLQELGAEVTLFDNAQPLRATQCSPFLMNPNWIPKTIGLAQVLELYKNRYGLREHELVDEKGKATKAWAVPRPTVLEDQTLNVKSRTIIGINTDPKDRPRIVWKEEKNPFRLLEIFDKIVVAAGWWSKAIEGLDWGKLTLRGGKGVSVEWVLPCSTEQQKGLVRTWAPYKQVVGLHLKDEDLGWGGDGSAILPANWSEDRRADSIERIFAHMAVKKEGGKPVTPWVWKEGIRPFAPAHHSDPYLLFEAAPSVWVATGGGKSGTAAAAAMALRLGEELFK